MKKGLTVKTVGKAFKANDHKCQANKEIIDILASAYMRARRRLAEETNGNYSYSNDVLHDSERIVYHIDSVIDGMDDQYKYILDNEVKLHKSGKWYLTYCSPTTYYRIREKAYQEFLNELDK